MIHGSKGGDSGSSRQPVQSPDSLISTQHAMILDLISEGETRGLVNGKASVFLNETPAAQNGQDTFAGFELHERKGTHDQSYIQGFPSSESEFGVNTTVEFGKPVVRAITSQVISAVRITLRVPRLSQTNTLTGDVGGTTLPYKIEVQTDGGAWITKIENSFTGVQTTNGYERSHRIDLDPSPTGWQVRVSRLNMQSTTDAKSDQMIFKAVSEVVDAKFTYRNSAVIGTRFDASQFSDIPSRAFDYYGRIIAVPSNYDAETRVYSGIWDGTFQRSYTDNPAWIYYDLLLNPRYGLGSRVKSAQVNKWELYKIAMYCDELVADGKGGMEPRYTCNLYLQTRQDALKVLQDVAQVFRGMAYWGNSEVVATADMPGDAVRTYGNSDVIGGKFSYKGQDGIARYNVALVTWNDLNDFGRQKVEYVEDRDEIMRQGKIEKVELIATGCNSQGQAQRNGRWALLTNNLEDEMVTFTVGVLGAVVRPGNLVRIFDADRSGRKVAGRIVASGLDWIETNIVPDVGAAGDTVTVVMPNATTNTRTIKTIVGTLITFTQPMEAIPVVQTSWGLETGTLAAQYFRVSAVSEATEKYTYQISCIKHVKGKYAAIDTGTKIVQPPISVLPDAIQPAPTNVELSSSFGVEQTMAVSTMVISWEKAEGAVRYEVQWRKSDGNWIYGGSTGTTQMNVQGIYTGQYVARVMAFSIFDNGSNWANSEYTDLDGKKGEPNKLSFITATGITMGMKVDWGFLPGSSDTLFTELQYSLSNSAEAMVTLGDFSYPSDSYTMMNLASGVRMYFRGRIKDRSGNVGQWSDIVSGLTISSGDVLLSYVTGQIDNSHLGEVLAGEIADINGNGPGSVNARLEAVREELQDQISDLTDALEWVSAKAYLKNDVVRLGNRLYRALANNTGSQPPSANWKDVGEILETADATALQSSENKQSIIEQGDAIIATQDQINLLQTKVNDPVSGLEAVATVATQTKQQVDTLDGTVTALNQTVGTMSVAVGENTAAITDLSETTATDIQTQAQRITNLNSDYQGNKAAVQLQISAISDESSATASKVDTLQVEVDGQTAAIQEAMELAVDADGKVTGSWSMRFQQMSDGTLVQAGIGLGFENDVEGNLQTNFVVNANTFAVYNGAVGAGGEAVFATSGQETYIKSAFIQNASINMLKIGDNLFSDDYVAGMTGWKLGKGGNIEFNGSVANGGRLTMTNKLIQIFDENGTLRVRLGIF